MSRIRRYLVPALLLLPVIFIGGKLLLTPVTTWRTLRLQEDSFGLNSGALIAVPNVEQCGWPWVYREAIDMGGLRPIDPDVEAYSFSFLYLFADATAALMIVAAAATILSWHHRRHGAWVRFSVRELLALIFVFAIVLGWLTHVRQKWAQEQRLIQVFAYLQPTSEYCGPQWLRRLWPDDDLTIFQRVTALGIPNADANFRADSLDKLLAAVQLLPHVRQVSVGHGPGQWINADEPSLETLEKLGLLSGGQGGLLSREIEDVSFNWLDDLHGKIELLKRLPARHLEFDTCNITADDMEIVGQVRAQEELRFRCDDVEQASLSHISHLNRLCKLDLSGTITTDDIVGVLERLPRLVELRLKGSNFYDTGYRRLTELPELRKLIVSNPSSISTETMQLLRRHFSVFLVN